MKLKNKKSTLEVGIGIILLAFLLLFSGIFINDNNNRSNINHYNIQNNNSNYIFKLTNTIIGKQNKISEGFPNIEVGAKKEKEIVYQTSSFKIYSNFLTKNIYEVSISNDKDEEVKYYLVYTKVNRKSGDDNVIAKINGKEGFNGDVNKNIPLVLTPDPKIFNANKTSYTDKITFEIKKPKFYQIWKWNNYNFNDFKILEVKRKKNQKGKSFIFHTDTKDLEKVILKITVDCKGSETEHNLNIYVNNYSISSLSFNCKGRYNTKEIEMPLNILKENNDLKFETEGYYKISYLINKIYYNEKFRYFFNIYNFNNIVDVIMYGDFNDDSLDLKINGKEISLERGDTISILNHIQYGLNRIEILNKPIEIKELYIEGIDYYWNQN